MASVKALVEYARSGGEGAEREALRTVCRYLALSLVNAYRLFDPDLILVCGPPEDQHDVLVDFLREEVNRYSPL